MSGFTDHQETASLAEDSWFDIYSVFAPVLSQAVENHPRHVPCPMHGGVDGFRLFDDARITGGGICNTCGAFPNGFLLLGWINGWDKNETLNQIGRYVGTVVDDEDGHIEQVAAHASSYIEDDDPLRVEALLSVWQPTVPADEPLAEPLRAYIQSRGLGASLQNFPGSLRYHDSLTYFEKSGNGGYEEPETHPAMVAAVQDVTGRLVSIQRTYLSTEGTKARVLTPKKLMSPIRKGATMGAAIRLYEGGDDLAVAEGIETALAVYLGTGLPVWATVSAVGMRCLQVPESVRKIYIMADLDQSGTGVDAANKLAARLVREGRDARVVVPPGPIPVGAKSLDWLDIYNATEEAGNE